MSVEEAPAPASSWGRGGCVDDSSQSNSLPPLPDLIPIRRTSGVRASGGSSDGTPNHQSESINQFNKVTKSDLEYQCSDNSSDNNNINMPSVVLHRYNDKLHQSQTFRSRGSTPRPIEGQHEGDLEYVLQEGVRQRLYPQSEEEGNNPPLRTPRNRAIDCDERSRDEHDATLATPTRRTRSAKLNQKHRKSDRRRREQRSERYLRRSISCSTTSSTASNVSVSVSVTGIPSTRRRERYNRQDSVLSVKSEPSAECVSPRVNPIFLWVKQDDTTIVEVRCEDYDKRNRIRLTKTPHGWRAIPRTESLGPPLSTPVPAPASAVSEGKPPRHKHSRTSKHKHKKKRKHSPTRRASEPSTLQVTETETSEQCNRSPPRVAECPLAAEDGVVSEPEELERERGPEPSEQEREQEQEQPGRDNNSPAWTLPVNIETHIPSHTITIPEKVSTDEKQNNDVTENVSERPTPSSPPPSPPKPHQEQENVVNPSSNANENENDENDENDGSPVVVARTVSPRAFEPVSASASAHSSALDNLLAVAELEFNHQEEIEHGTETDMDMDMDMDMGMGTDSPGCNKSYHNYQSITPRADTESHSFFDQPSEKMTSQYIDVHVHMDKPTNEHDFHSEEHSFEHNIIVPKDLFESINESSYIDAPIEASGAELDVCDTMNAVDLLDSLVEKGCEDNHVILQKPDKMTEYTEKLVEIVEFNENITETINKFNEKILGNPELCAKIPLDVVDKYDRSKQTEQVKEKNEPNVDDYNEDDDDDMMENEPVSDIIDRLGESLDSPKQTVQNVIGFQEDDCSNDIDLFANDNHYEQNNNMEVQSDENANKYKDNISTELDMSKENKGYSDVDGVDDSQPTDLCMKKPTPDFISDDIKMTSLDNEVSDDDLPKDLSCPKRSGMTSPSPKPLENRPNSRSSDTIQSPQPSGIPAVPPSPDIFQANSLKSTNKSLFLESLLASPSAKMTTPNDMASRAQKEPLDLGKCRKSASPTVSCSEEAKNTPAVLREGEPEPKRIKMELPAQSLPQPVTTVREKPIDTKKNESRLMDILGSVTEPDALAQLKLLISNPEWSVPDPLLVPKDRLNSILMAPAREIPLLLALRPELRIPDALAYPAILQDPDILVISLAQLEAIIKKQIHQATKTAANLEKSKKNEEQLKLNNEVQKYQQQKMLEAKLKQMNTTVRSTGLANDIDAATTAAFNQMMWLPYLNQLEVASMCNNPDVFKALNTQFPANYPCPMDVPIMQNRFVPQFPMPGSVDYNNLELAMWQQQMMQANNNANLQRAMKNTVNNVSNESVQYKNNYNMENNHMMNMNHMQNKKSHNIPGSSNKLHSARTSPIAHGFQQRMNNYNAPSFQQNYANMRQMPNIQIPQYNGMVSSNAKPSQQRAQQQHHSPRSLKQQPSPNSSTARKQHANFASNYAQLQHQHQQQQQQQQQQQYQNEQKLRENNKKLQQQQQQHHQDSKPRVTCKSLLNLLQPTRIPQESVNKSKQGDQPKVSNLMQQPSLTSAPMDLSGQRIMEPKLKVKQHLIDPNLPRRLLKHEEIPEVGSTTVGLDEMTAGVGADPQTHLWHPLFGNQKSYNSPWNWTTVTVNGE